VHVLTIWIDELYPYNDDQNKECGTKVPNTSIKER